MIVALFCLFVSVLALAEEPAPPPAPRPTTSTPAFDPATLPPELAPWVAWVRASHPELSCARVDGSVACLWPGRLGIVAGAAGADVSLDVEVDRDLAVPLPGGAGAWPQDVRVDGVQSPVLDVGGVPMVSVRAGRHALRGRIPWRAMPQSLPVPNQVGRIDLTVDGAPVARPRLDADGTLRLGTGDVERPEGNRIDLDVSRLVEDGVPLRVTTRVAVRAAGSAREVNLGAVLLAGTTPVRLDADLPARLDEDGALVLQVRPGNFTVTLVAVAQAQVDALAAPDVAAPWPDTETWAFRTDERVRAVDLSGPAGVDPARTALPDDWRSLATYLVQPSTPLTITTLRRGDPEPPPNDLRVSRELWLDLDGGGLTARDRIDGVMRRGWRVDAAAPSALGQVLAGDTGQVITTVDGRAGVEWREEQVSLVGDARIEGRPRRLPAVGWQIDASSLSATLNLPPGWTLFTAFGVDDVGGSVLDRWTLFDLFFVLVTAMFLARLLGLRWGVLALVGLAVARHTDGAPMWTWVWLAVVLGLESVLSPQSARTVARWVRVASIVGLFALVVPFAVHEVRVGLFPALDAPTAGGGYSGLLASAERESEMYASEDAYSEAPSSASAGLRAYKAKRLAAQVDPSAVVQTGPGVPQWSWHGVSLGWSGPVAATHDVRLVLVGPMGNLVLSLLRVALLLALALRVLRWRPPSRDAASPAGGGVAGAAVAGVVGVALALGLVAAPSAAWAAPPDSALEELHERLVVAPACGAHCVEAPSVSVTVDGASLVVEAEVHAAIDSAWPVPGPTSVWVPADLRVDGVSTSAAARRGDGFLYVRVDAGVHRVRVAGPLPAGDSHTLQWGLVPKRVVFDGDGWAIDGLKADGRVERSVQLTRTAGRPASDEPPSGENLAPWLTVTRTLDLGIPWRVETVVRREGPAQRPVAVKVPLLPGEAVTDAAFEAQDGVVLATLDRDQTEASWLSTLEVTERVELVAPQGVGWTEVWRVSCAPLYACAAEGIAPVAHVEDGVHLPEYRPWPGESLALAVSRPDALAGQTTTIDRATVELSPGRRLLQAKLALVVRSSQGGVQVVTLPEGAEVMQLRVDRVERPPQVRDGALQVPLAPGRQEIEVEWRQDRTTAVVDRMPALDLGGPAVNIEVQVRVPEERWIAGLFGPRWGPVPLFWSWVVIVVIAAVLLGRVKVSPLSTLSWALLGLGLSQVPVVVGLIVVGWLLALGWRAARDPVPDWAFDTSQVALVLLTPVALVCLYAAVHAGLLFRPDLQVTGNGSSDTYLVWTVDRVVGVLPRPTVVSFPIWVWRVLMLAWSLWLAASLVRWLPMGWRAFSDGGVVSPSLREAFANATRPRARKQPTVAPPQEPTE